MDLRWCYASNLGGLIDRGQPDLWIHGHPHNRVEYRLGRTRIICNPRGHVEETSARTFDPSLTIQVARRPQIGKCLGRRPFERRRPRQRQPARII